MLQQYSRYSATAVTMSMMMSAFAHGLYAVHVMRLIQTLSVDELQPIQASAIWQSC